MQEPDEILRAYVADKSITQEQLCENANVSQATVSRALKRTPRRRGRAWVRLFTYVTRELSVSSFSEGGKEKVLAAVERVWDGTDTHAVAIARIIDALAGLRPSGEEEQ
jgi:transcriptional regulator with XRE-family HTH domain